MYRTSPPYRQRLSMAEAILIIGDGIAEGVGDSVAHCGLASRLNRLLVRHRTDFGLNFSWHALTAGRLYSKSKDWLPVCDNQDGCTAQWRSLFRDTFLTGPFRSSKVVIILLGNHDEIDEAESTVSNIVLIADAIVKLDKEVLVCSIPIFHNAQSAEARMGHARNAALGEALAGLSRHSSTDGSVTYGVDLQKILARGGEVMYSESGFSTLNNFGYRALAREILDEVAPVAKRVEWRHWKARLTPSASTSS